MGRSDSNSSTSVTRSVSTNGDSRSIPSDNSDSYNIMINQPELQPGKMSVLSMTKLTSQTAPLPASSSSPHLLARASALPGPNNTSIDLTAYVNKNSNNNSVTRQPSSSTPRTVDDMGMRGRRSDGVDGVSGGSGRRRSKRLIPNETVVPNTNELPRSDRERRKDLFREDFPDEPIPSNAILMRLYGNLNIPPPPPYSNNMEEQGSASNGSWPTSLVSGLNKLLVKPPVISPVDLPASSGHTSFTSHEWTWWKDSDDKPMKERSTMDDTNRSESSSKSKHTNDDTRRSESPKSKHSTVSSRRSPCNHRRDHSRRSRDHHARYSSKTLPHIRSSELSSSILHKSKSNRRRDGLSSSAHGTYSCSPVVSSPKRSRNRGETIKNKSKTSSRNSSHDRISSSHGTPSRKALHKVSHHDNFQNAILDLSNGSFDDSFSAGSEHKTSTSLEILRASFNSSPSFNDSSKSFAEWDEKTNKEPKKKRIGKRGSCVASESKRRSKSADENRTGSTKGTRRGRRSSETKVSTIDRKSNDEEPLSLSKLYGDDSLEFELHLNDSMLNDSRLNDSRLSSSRGGSQKSLSNEFGVKQRKSPRSFSRKTMSNESGAKQRKSPKIREKKELSNESGAKLRKSPKIREKKELSNESGAKQRKSPKVLLKKEMSSRSTSSRSLRSPRTMKKNVKGASVKTYTSLSSRSTEQEYVVQLSPKDGVSKVASKEEKKSEGDDFYDLAVSSWIDIPTETFQTEASSSSSSPKEKTPFSNNETPRRKNLARKTRWQPEPGSTLNGMSPSSSADTTTARVPDVTTMDSTGPTTENVPDLPKASKTLNFPLNFEEYQNVSPLTVASKKMARVDVHLMSSLACL